MSDSLESQILANASKDDAASKPTSSALSTDFLPEDIQLFIELYTAKLRKTITT